MPRLFVGLKISRSRRCLIYNIGAIAHLFQSQVHNRKQQDCYLLRLDRKDIASYANDEMSLLIISPHCK